MKAHSSHKALWAERRAKGLCGECGHVPSKLSRCSLCRQFVNEARRKWWRRGAGRRLNRLKREAYAQNPELFKERAKRYREENPEKELSRNRQYYLAHQEEAKAKARAHYWANRERVLASKRKRAA